MQQQYVSEYIVNFIDNLDLLYSLD